MLATLPVIGCSSESNESGRAFQQACPKPDWWDEVSIERVQIENLDQLSEYWKRKTRSARKFFKAAYQAILDHSLDQDLVVHALKWMPVADYHYPHTTKMLEFAVNRYFYYDRPLADYSGKKGDMIGGIVQELIRRYNDSERYDVTVKLVERLLSKRRGDVNDHMLELISLTPQQQAIVDEVAYNAYRPCCGNMIAFPDCNHGMAALALTELMASQGASADEIFQALKEVSPFWFPTQYHHLALYFELRDQEWKDVDPRMVMGNEYSSGDGWKQVNAQLQQQGALGTGGVGGGNASGCAP